MHTLTEIRGQSPVMNESEGNLIGIFSHPPRTETHAALLALVSEVLEREARFEERAPAQTVEH